MKIIIQRVNFAKIFVNNEFKGEIQKGIVAYVGVANGDCEKDIDFCIDKLINLRIFDDENGKLNLSYTDSAKANEAQEIYNLFLQKLKDTNIRFETGEFGQYMRTISENDGPVNLILSSDL